MRTIALLSKALFVVVGILAGVRFLGWDGEGRPPAPPGPHEAPRTCVAEESAVTLVGARVRTVPQPDGRAETDVAGGRGVVVDSAPSPADEAEAATRSSDESRLRERIGLFREHRDQVCARLCSIALNAREPERVRVLAMWLIVSVAPPQESADTQRVLSEFLRSAEAELKRQALFRLDDQRECVEALVEPLRLLADGEPSCPAVGAMKTLVRWDRANAHWVSAALARWLRHGARDVLEAAVDGDLLRGLDSDVVVDLLLPHMTTDYPDDGWRFVSLGRDVGFLEEWEWTVGAARTLASPARARLLEALGKRTDVAEETVLLARACWEGLRALPVSEAVRVAQGLSEGAGWVLLSSLAEQAPPSPAVVAAVLKGARRRLWVLVADWVGTFSEEQVRGMQDELGREATSAALWPYRTYMRNPGAQALVVEPQAPARDDGP